MKRNLAVKAALLLSVALLGVGTAQVKKNVANAQAMYGETMAKPGQSEIVIENSLSSALSVYVDGKLEGTVKARSVERFVVADGGRKVKVQNMAKGGGTSRDVDFYTQSKRFIFKVTSSSPSSISLHRDSVYDITEPNTAATSGPVNSPTVSETTIGKDKASMFDRMDTQVAAASKPAPQPAAPAPTPAAQPAPTAPAAPAAQPAAVKPAQKSHVAIYVTGDRTDGEKKVLGTKILASLINSGNYVAVERADEFLAAIEQEHMKQRDNTVDDNQISALGKQFGVQFICVTNITEALGSFQVSARIIDVETAVVIAIGEGSSQLRDMKDMDAIAYKVAQALLRK